MTTVLLLQWGHAFVSVETYGRTKKEMNSGLLQWGHAFVSVETPLRPSPRTIYHTRFNEATLL